MGERDRLQSGWQPFFGEPGEGATRTEGALFPLADGSYVAFADGQWWRHSPDESPSQFAEELDSAPAMEEERERAAPEMPVGPAEVIREAHSERPSPRRSPALVLVVLAIAAVATAGHFYQSDQEARRIEAAAREAREEEARTKAEKSVEEARLAREAAEAAEQARTKAETDLVSTRRENKELAERTRAAEAEKAKMLASGYSVAQTIDEQGVYMPVIAGWTVERDAFGAYLTIDVSQSDRLIRINVSPLKEEADLMAYPRKQETAWKEDPDVDFEGVALREAEIEFATAGKVKAVEWEFRMQDSKDVRLHTRIWYYRWKGKAYALMMRSPDLSGMTSVDSEMREMIKLHDAR